MRKVITGSLLIAASIVTTVSTPALGRHSPGRADDGRSTLEVVLADDGSQTKRPQLADDGSQTKRPQLADDGSQTKRPQLADGSLTKRQLDANAYSLNV